ncbi:MAG: NADH-quinone oxidoreductase subunit N [Francisellaceae bacterium]|jgi:NADH-quinone oxidoreductase subunit N|nr:NADH-quinone oxidoreductase subunit N [Francisellaceae bacterium]MBT6207111.1 NADH-quinone oxidoreductase subunit N [Francisellaceae bacterium]MBT6539597.1 NADH-quinone oxidoreductase subunit N [Francisellaceae bacterium]
MNLITLYWLTPELIICSAGILSLLIGLMQGEIKKSLLCIVNQTAFLAVIIICYQYLAMLILGDMTAEIASNTLIIDSFSLVIKMVIATLSFVVFLYSRVYVESQSNNHGEYYSLAMFSILGMMILASATNFLSLYLGIELLSLPLYALVALNDRRKLAIEAGMKYFITGGLASSIMLFGISIIYAVNGDLSIVSANSEALSSSHTLPFTFGIVCLWVGIAFKLGAAPFHQWVPDVYHGAPLSLTMFISSLPKLAAFAIVYRIFSSSFIGMHSNVQTMIMVTAVLSITVGTLSALWQTNIKRLLAYSAIANIGYMLLAVFVGAYEQALFYLIVYAIAIIGVFGLILSLSSVNEREELKDLSGLAKSQPILGLTLMFLVLSMAGIPPFVGFYAKLMIFQSLLDGSHWFLVIFGLLMSVVGAFYYLKIIKIIYFEEQHSKAPPTTLYSCPSSRAMLVTNGLLALLLGLYPIPILNICSLIG